jgi:hypothetical protein
MWLAFVVGHVRKVVFVVRDERARCFGTPCCENVAIDLDQNRIADAIFSVWNGAFRSRARRPARSRTA